MLINHYNTASTLDFFNFLGQGYDIEEALDLVVNEGFDEEPP